MQIVMTGNGQVIGTTSWADGLTSTPQVLTIEEKIRRHPWQAAVICLSLLDRDEKLAEQLWDRYVH